LVEEGTTFPLPFINASVNALPLHTVSTVSLIDGVGFTVIEIVKGAPLQDPNVGSVTGVTVYVAVWFEFVLLTRLPVIEVWLVPDAPPVIPPVTGGAGQLYVVPAGIEVDVGE
jgi:hypothetical protein